MAVKAMRKVCAGSIIAASLVMVAAVPAAATYVHRRAQRLVAVHHDTSRPLRDIAPAVASRSDQVVPLHRLPRPAPTGVQTVGIQRSAAILAAPATLLNFAGIGNGFSGPGGTFSVSAAPPDPNAAVGPN